MYYLQSRYYDPETGRFINADTLIVASDYLQGTNMYAYCLNNPVMYVDPTGCDPYIMLCYGKMLEVIQLVQEFLIFARNYDQITKSNDITDKLNSEMKKNEQIMIDYYNEHGFIKSAIFFAEKVRPGGEWDLKSRDDWGLKSGTTYIYGDEELRYDDIGNIHYGYVGSVLFGADTLLNMGGVIQIFSGTSKWSFRKHNFDDPRDQWAIQFGIDLRKKGLA